MHRFMAPVNLAPQQIPAGNTNETVQLPKEYVKRKGFVGIPIYVIGLMFYQGSYIYRPTERLLYSITANFGGKSI